MKTKWLVLPVLACLLYLNANSQPTFSGWLASFNTIKTGSKTSIHNDIQWRSSDQLQHTQTLLLRGGLNFHVSKKIIVTAGYAFIHNRRVSGNVSGYAPEHRTWEQLILNHAPGRILSSHRFRLEQRFIAKTIVSNNQLEREGSDYANRLRYFTRHLFPFRRQASFQKGVFAALQNEVFVNFGNTDAVNGKFFDQNRFYVAAGWRIHPSFDIETGYMNQYTSGRGSSFTNNHIVQLAGYLRL